ncbi:MAG: hypothetical protein CYG60_15625 [Actinobacteria bacterium]|jgi:hypothetical protein|nr:MAG: hypothetical protein CYG60_15625 [Actinomycetota bacterium]
MNDLDNAREKLGEAVQTLASGTGPLRQRLYNCYRDLGVLDPARLADEHEGLAQGLEELKNAFTWLPASDERPDLGRLYGTLDALDKDEAQKLAQRVVGLYEDGCRELYTRERPG